jgi:uncharacterized protein
MNTTLVDRWYAAIRDGDAGALTDVVTDDVVLLWNGDTSHIPWAGTHVGVAAVLAFFQNLGRHIEVVSVTPLYRLDAGDAVVVVLEGRWKTRNTQCDVAARACNIFRFRNGRISAYEVYNDSGKFAAALLSA